MWSGVARVGRSPCLSKYHQECNLCSSSGRAKAADLSESERGCAGKNAAPVCLGPFSDRVRCCIHLSLLFNSVASELTPDVWLQ